MKKKNIYIWIAAGLLFIAIVNVPPVDVIFAIIVGDKSLKYPDYHFSGENPKGFSIWMDNDGISRVRGKFTDYQKYFPDEKILYRNFSINPLKFWRWREYFISPLYNYPYRKLPNKSFEAEYGIDLDSLRHDNQK